METLLVDNHEEVRAITQINHYLDEHIFDKRKKEVCLVFAIKPTHSFFKLVLLSFYEHKSAFLKMIKYEKNNKTILEKRNIYASENVDFEEPKIIVGNVHEGAKLFVYTNLVFIGEIKGIVYLKNEKSSIYANKFINASFICQNGQKKIINGENILISYEELEDL